MIWDFRGPHAQKIAEHHEVHLKDFIKSRPKLTEETGTETLSSLHSLAYMIVPEAEAHKLKELLKPHRGQYCP